MKISIFGFSTASQNKNMTFLPSKMLTWSQNINFHLSHVHILSCQQSNIIQIIKRN